MSGPLHTVHVRINGPDGQPTPARVRFWQPGAYYSPLGRVADVSPADLSGGSVRLGGVPFALTDGSFEVPLPAEPVQVEIRKGFEYLPIQREVTLGPGKLTLRFTLERWADLRQDGWYSGDTAAFLLTHPHAALLEAAAEDLAVVNLLALEWKTDDRGHRSLPNIVAFSGQRPALEMPGHAVVVNTRNDGATLGSLGLLNCHRAVYPLGALDEAGRYAWTLDDWCDQCHRKGGLVLWAGFGRPLSERPGPANDGYGGETLANLILGKIDALEVDRLDWAEHLPRDEWYRLLNCGLRVPLAAGSAKHSNAVALGSLRTYARLRPGEEFSYKNWIEAVRAGRTFVSNGPLLSFTVDGLDPGARIDLPADGPRKVRVRAEARSVVPFERLELVLNGDAVAGVEASGEPASALLEGEFEVPGPCWLAARCWGPQPAFAASQPERDHVAAHTSPVHVQVQGQSFPVDIISLALLIERLDKMLTWMASEVPFDGERTRNHLHEVLQAARAELVRRGAR